MAGERLRIAWILPASRVRGEVEDLKKEGGVVESEQEFEPNDEERDRYAHAAFEPLTVVVCSLAAGFLAERLSRFAKSLRHGGLIIDLRTDPVTVREEHALDFGTAYVVNKEGLLTQISKPESTDLLAVITASTPRKASTPTNAAS